MRKFASAQAFSCLATTSFFAVAAMLQSGTAQAQVLADQSAQASPAEDVAPAAAQGGPSTGDVVVTGTRLQTGAQAPTPVTVIGSREIATQAPRSITDVVNQVPSIVGSMTPSARSIQASNGTQGISAPALRGVGTNRTLVLLDGKRSPPVTQTGETDIEMIPQQLVTRIDVVTGGASAAYGSDALAGVINFVLDHNFTGVKGEVSGGFTTYGDDENYKVSLSAGMKFGGDRGHLLLSGEHFYNGGIFGNQTGQRPKRDWQYGSPGVIANPNYTATNGQPQYIVAPNYASAAATRGGIIVAAINANGSLNLNSPLRGIAFTPAGEPYRFNFGTLDLATGIPLYMSGGDWQAADVTGLMILDPRMRRDNLFGRLSYEVGDGVNLFVQGGWSKNKTRGGHSTYAQQGDLVVSADNAFLPASVASQARSLGVSSFRFGRFKEGERQGGLVRRETFRALVGADGSVDLFGDSYKWEVSAQRGLTKSKEEITGVRLIDQYNRSIDSIISPTTGRPVCRVNADASTTNDDPACVPYNIFGFPPDLDPAVFQYAFGGGHPTRWQDFTQDVFAGSISGSPFDSWAGPVSIATGIEHRREKGEGRVDAISQNAALPTAQQVGLKRWGTPFLPVNGSYHVTEAFLEAELPLARDLPFARSLDLNGAVRATDYSTSGYVTTWKAGATWTPVDGVRVRVTRSRDIRAPNLSELYSLGLRSTLSIIDPFRGNETSPLSAQVLVGNTNLKPEKADTFGAGIVLQPAFLPGFTASVDYYNIDIKDAIGAITGQQVVDLCFQGRQELCGNIEREGGTIINGLQQVSLVRSSFFNFASQLARGIDFEVNYRLPVTMFPDQPGSLAFRIFATHFLKNEINNGINPPYDIVGDMRQFQGTPQIGGISKWKGTASITYSDDALTASVMARGVSAGFVGGLIGSTNQYLVCSSNCPASTSARPTINDNHVPGAVYVDTSIAYRIRAIPLSPELFFSVRNIGNKDPALTPRGPLSGLPYGIRPTNELVYDMLGRVFRFGVRFQM